MNIYRIEEALDSSDLAKKASRFMASCIRRSLDKRKRVQIALAGGSTPSLAYEILGKENLPWDHVDVFVGDERWIDSSNEESNASLVRKTLLSQKPGSDAVFHKFPTVELANPIESAAAFSSIIEDVCTGEPPIFDLVVLGLGEDGHTASLFPGTDATKEFKNWTTVSYGKGMERVSLTAPVLSSARQVLFLVSGASKKQALHRLLDINESPIRTPACLVKPNSEILVIADKASLN